MKIFCVRHWLRQCFAKAKPIRLKISLFFFPKTAKGVQKLPELQNLASKKPKWQPYYTRIENAHKVRKKSFDFLLCIEVQKT